MSMARTSLDGLRLRRQGRDEIWMIFHGLRHYVADHETYQSLFVNEHILQQDDIESIAQGPDLHPGACLVRAYDSDGIYLVFGRPSLVRYFIPTLESFQEFGFDMSKVIGIPPIVLDSIPVGQELESAADYMRHRDFA